MNDLDDLKQALNSPPDYAPRSLDLDEIMSSGGRLRRRRRLAVGSAAGVAVVGLLVGGSQLIGPGNPTPKPGTGFVAPVAAAPTPTPSAVRSDPSVPPPKKPYGDVIRTGLFAGDAEYVLYAAKVDEPVLPDTHFGIMLALRQKNGDLASGVFTNEFKGSDRAPGFHAGQGAMNVDGNDTLTFGYYVGNPKRITAFAKARKVTAHLAKWSEDPSVTVYWFAPADAKPDTGLTKLAAYDRTGKKLTTGNSSIGVG